MAPLQEQYANLAWSSLASGIDAITTDLAVQQVDAHLFPLVGQFRLKVEDELMLATVVVASGRYTVTRGVEGTTAATHSGLSVVRHILTAASVAAVCGQTDLYGTLANRPAAGVVGRRYFATDTSTEYRDNGTTWDTLTVAATGVTIRGANVDTDQSTTSTSFTDLATVGPTVSGVTGSTVTLWFSCNGSRNGTGNSMFMGFAVSGATTLAASDNNSVAVSSYAANFALAMSRVITISGLTPGLNVFTAKYRVDGGTFNFSRRSIAVAF